MVASEDDIVAAVLRNFEALPASFKPHNRGNGNQEWVPLSGIVITRGTSYDLRPCEHIPDETIRKDDHDPTCISFA